MRLARGKWSEPCFFDGMNFWLLALSAQVVFIAAQIVISVVANIRDRGEDGRFVGDKVAFRS